MISFRKTILTTLFITILLFAGCVEEDQPSLSPENSIESQQYPKIASWLAKKDEILQSGKPYSLVMSGWFTPEEVETIKSRNPDALCLAGLTVNWVYNSAEWITFLETVASYGREDPLTIHEDMYLKNSQGERCAFGWASDEWGSEEIYAMDPRNSEWVELITSFYKNVLAQPQHDGIIVDMVTEHSWCPEIITNSEWIHATQEIMAQMEDLNTENKLVIFNAGRDFSEIDKYSEYMDGYLMENFLGEQFGAGFDEGLEAAQREHIVIYAVDTDNTGKKDMKRMRLGLTLSLLNDNTYISYDFGPRDHGQAWWFPEYDVDLGEPLGSYVSKNDAYWREFEEGIVVASPHTDTSVSFEKVYMDVTTGETSQQFAIEQGDGRIFVLPDGE